MMSRLTTIRLLVVLALAALPGVVRADLTADITAVMDAHMTAKGVPGAVVGVWQGDTNIALVQRGFGDRSDNTAISSLDHYRIGSVTKSFTVTRLLQLAGTGVIDLDRTIGSYNLGVHNGSATLRQLANMTSGIYNYTEDTAWGNKLFADGLTQSWTDEQLVAATQGHDPYFTPGAGWHYSNTATVLLGMVIEKETGHSLASEITDHVITPLGLSHTSYPAGITLPEMYAHGYFIGSEPGQYGEMTESNPSLSSGSGAMVSQLDDMRIWAKSLAEGTLLTSEMQEMRLEMISTAGGIGPEYDSYGLGIGELSGWLGHTGAYFGYQNLVMYDSATDQTVVIYTNLFDSGHIPTDIFREIEPLLVPEPSAILLSSVGLGLVWFMRRQIIQTSRR